MNNYSSSIVKVVSQALYRTFMWMSIGLFLTGFTSYYLSSSRYMFYFLHGSMYGSFFRVVLFGSQFAIALGLFLGFVKLSYNTLKSLFIAFSIISGATLSYIFLLYDLSSIIGIFFITAGMFFGLCMYGLLTKKDLSPFYVFINMVFWGMFIFCLINLFWKSAVFNSMLNVVGIFVFSFLTAMDIQTVKKMLSEYAFDAQMQKKLSIIGAVIMYQNFLNIFLRLLQLFGKRKNN